MNELLETLKVWQGYPAAIATAISPWLAPFQELNLINNRWRPEIDGVVDLLVVLFVLYLMGEHRASRQTFCKKKSLFLGIASASISIGVCYATKTKIIHLIDADLVWLANIPWALAYCFIFLSLAFVVFLLMMRGSE